MSCSFQPRSQLISIILISQLIAVGSFSSGQSRPSAVIAGESSGPSRNLSSWRWEFDGADQSRLAKHLNGDDIGLYFSPIRDQIESKGLRNGLAEGNKQCPDSARWQKRTLRTLK